MPDALNHARPETWGDSVKRHVPSLRASATLIEQACGPFVGTRNTFRKVFSYETEPTESDARVRAWLLLVANGTDPADFGIKDSELPPAWDPHNLRDLLLPAICCMRARPALDPWHRKRAS